jgi:RNA polymerase sigma-70 factor (ECF subfamily)
VGGATATVHLRSRNPLIPGRNAVRDRRERTCTTCGMSIAPCGVDVTSIAPPSTDRHPRATDAVDESTLLAALRQREEWAFEVLVRSYGGRLLAVARRICGNEEDARDVLQSAYLSAFRSLDTFEGTAHLSTWLHRIVVNTALMRLRSKRRKPEDPIETLLPAFHDDGHHVEQFSDWAVPVDTLLEREDVRATVRQCIAQLPDKYREVLLLRDIEELSTGKAATLLNVSPTAVKVRLHRARQALSTLLRRELTAGVLVP